MRGFCVWTVDDQTWHGPRATEGTSGYYVWWLVSDGVAYLCGRRKLRTARNEADELRLLQATLLASRGGFSGRRLRPGVPRGRSEPRVERRRLHGAGHRRPRVGAPWR